MNKTLLLDVLSSLLLYTFNLSFLAQPENREQMVGKEQAKATQLAIQDGGERRQTAYSPF